MKKGLLIFPLLLSLACGANDSDDPQLGAGSGGKGPASGGNGSGGSGTSGNGTSGAGVGAGPLVGEGGPIPPGTVGQVTDVETKLPPLPVLANVAGTVREDSVGVDFHPFDNAADYRIYVLPADADITANADGSVVVKNAIYRCAGLRQTTDLETNLNKDDPLLYPLGAPYHWKGHVDENPTLGYVYLAPAEGRIPVYAVAGYQTRLDGQWYESRFKIYTTDEAERDKYLAQNWRDDGVAFYVPEAAGAGTQTIYSSQKSEGTDVHNRQYYFGEAKLGERANDTHKPAPAFQVLKEAAEGTQPLMAVQYMLENDHTELAVGLERFKRAANQGNGPLWHLEWSGIKEPTTLVIEALATGCPFQGFLSPQPLEAPPHQTLFTLDQLQANSPTGEVFINGQHDEEDFPKAIARSFIKVEPKPHNPDDWDWWEGFSDPESFGPVVAVDYPECKDNTCGRWQSSKFDFTMWSVDTPGGIPFFTHGVMLGQLWTVFDDWMQDVTGKLRFTALEKANVDADPEKFLHITWSVDIVGTDRRYPQLIVSDRDAPVQQGMSDPENDTLLIQTIDGPSMRFETQAIHGLVKGSSWDINNQATGHIFMAERNDSELRPVDPIFEHAGVDRQTTFDAYISAERLYVYFDGQPAGCTLYPPEFQLAGPVTVTFGDVIYHEGAEDELVCYIPRPYSYLHRHSCMETRRHFDDLGFKSGVKPPAWDESKFPCLPY